MEYKKPLIIVISLTYNNFDYLEETINSVYPQDYPNIEIILSDDGSSNYDLDYIKRITSKKPDNIRNLQIIHHEKNIGTVKNLNNCRLYGYMAMNRTKTFKLSMQIYA